MALAQTLAGHRFKVAVIGGGLGGVAAGYYLRRAGIEDFAILEKADGLGGTWRENTYPGAGCDVASHMYSYSFERHYPWRWRYAKQPEILAYVRHCAERHGIAAHVHCNAALKSAEFDGAQGLWHLVLVDGTECDTDFLVSAVGQLDHPAIPSIPGRDSFTGPAFHSARWDHGVDLTGKRVAVIGTGASAIQFVPEIAEQVAKLYVYQRSPGWTAPKMEKQRSHWSAWCFDHIPGLETLDRLRLFLIMESLAFAYNGHPWAERIARFISAMQLRLQVRDPALRARLTPDFPIGCKRILLTSRWYKALLRPNVEVMSDGIQAITAAGIQTTDGQTRDVDAIVYGTGFAATTFLASMRIVGREGRELHDTWRNGADAYLGMAVSGFPNFFMIYGPNTNLGAGSIIFMLECQARYIAQLIAMRERAGWREVEVTRAAHEAYAREMDRRSATTTYNGNCHNWYKTATGRNTNNWVGSCTEFRRRTRTPDMACYAVRSGGHTAVSVAPLRKRA
ncbi:MAG TPA: NAD(P)/FAD-dependent oxidoreductase [Nevskiaceae bacterium]|nr:NAD(P)/FAD-dependent oxidoreductase [Nevskiaceae bacterium]